MVWTCTVSVEFISLQENFLKYNNCQVTTSVSASKVLKKLAQKLPLSTAQLLLSCADTDTFPQVRTLQGGQFSRGPAQNITDI